MPHVIVHPIMNAYCKSSGGININACKTCHVSSPQLQVCKKAVLSIHRDSTAPGLCCTPLHASASHKPFLPAPSTILSSATSAFPPFSTCSSSQSRTHSRSISHKSKRLPETCQTSSIAAKLTSSSKTCTQSSSTLPSTHPESKCSITIPSNCSSSSSSRGRSFWLSSDRHLVHPAQCWHGQPLSSLIRSNSVRSCAGSC